MTTIIGVDYSGAQDEGKTWIARGSLTDGGEVILNVVHPIRREDLHDLLLAVPTPAVVALDFPFSLPSVFLDQLCIRTNTMNGVWPHIADMLLGSSKNPNVGTYRQRCGGFGTHPKRTGDECYTVSMSALNTRLVPMTYHGIKMLDRLSAAKPNRWWIPPRDIGPAPVDRTVLLEVMPGALLWSIGLDYGTVKGYKGAAGALDTRERVIHRLSEYAKAALGIPHLLDLRLGFRANDDSLDAVVAYVAAALWARDDNLFHRPEDHQDPAVLAAARLEGWIYAPNPPEGGNPPACRPRVPAAARPAQ